MFKVEYLITVDKKEPFCKTVEGFNNFIKTIEGVSIVKNEMRFESLCMQYEVQAGDIKNDGQRFFHLKLSSADAARLLDFETLLRNIRGVLHKASGRSPQVLWDGVSFNYAQTSYPIVHEIENTMRKLITKFMLINVGIRWASEAVPKEVIDSVRLKDAKLDQNYLYQVDFIQLSNFLFKEYSNINLNSLIDQLRKVENVGELNLEELKLAIPRSNWDRFFSKVVNCESDYLRTRWERLYEKRNQIAHNRPVSRMDFDEICSLRDELAPKLHQAIESLDSVTVSDDERELVTENAATSKGFGYSEFLSAWSELHRQLYLLATLLARNSDEEAYVRQQQNNVRALVNIATRDYKLLTLEQRASINGLLRLRNYMVHQPDIIVPNVTLLERVESATYFSEIVREKIRQILTNGIHPELFIDLIKVAEASDDTENAEA